MKDTQPNNKNPHWWFYPGWVVLNNIIIVLAWYITWAIMNQLVAFIGGRIEIAGHSRITEDFLFIFLFLPVTGLLAGFVQYILLRPYLPRMGWWVATTFLSWIMPIITGSLIANLLNASNNILLIMLGMSLIGVSIALPQWWMLRQRVQHAFLWILAYGLGWGVNGLLALVTTEPLPFLLAMALIPNITTVFVLWLLLDGIPRLETNNMISNH
ncbi:MAG: hypothetical protein CL609_25230 [Anaerolineaceae bacterium]|nr:hypothetical protein [Anaerolineaceae bacterium]